MTNELKALRNKLQSTANKKGNFSVDLIVTVYGQSVTYNARVFDISTLSEITTCSNSPETLEEKMINEIEGYFKNNIDYLSDHFNDPLGQLDDITNSLKP